MTVNPSIPEDLRSILSGLPTATSLSEAAVSSPSAESFSTAATGGETSIHIPTEQDNSAGKLMKLFLVDSDSVCLNVSSAGNVCLNSNCSTSHRSTEKLGQQPIPFLIVKKSTNNGLPSPILPASSSNLSNDLLEHLFSLSKNPVEWTATFGHIASLSQPATLESFKSKLQDVEESKNFLRTPGPKAKPKPRLEHGRSPFVPVESNEDKVSHVESFLAAFSLRTKMSLEAMEAEVDETSVSQRLLATHPSE